MLSLPRALIVLLVVALVGEARAARLGAYDYPFVDPLVATVVRTPRANAIDLPALIEGQGIRRFHLRGLVDRPPPPVFFYERHGLPFTLAAQPGPAPLVIIIAGTGGGVDASITRELATILHAAGNHVLALPNPTHISFLVNASTSGVPGRLEQDTADLYRAIQAALALVRGRIEITRVDLTGYSLGATYAAFLSELDSRERAVGFDRVLLLNPAVSVYESMRIVDEMLRVHERADAPGIRRFIEEVLAAFGEVQAQSDTAVEFAGDFVYRAYAALDLTAVDLEKLIGLAFRLSAANLVFIADVLSQGHVLVPEGVELTTTSSLTGYFLEARRFSFEDYFERIVLPYHARLEPGITKASMIADADLGTIEAHLATTPGIGLLVNEDDFILRPQDLAFLERVFAGRAAVYPTGGHCGNYRQRDVALRIQAFFRDGSIGH